MRNRCDFWVCIVEAADSVDREGGSFDERIRNIAQSFRSLPSVALDEVAQSFLVLTEVCKAVDKALSKPAQ